MFCALPVNELLASLLLPRFLPSSSAPPARRPRVRIPLRLSQEHVEVLLSAAEQHFCGRVNATARAIFEAAMQRRLPPPTHCLAEETQLESFSSEWTLFTVQVDEIHRDWLCAFAHSRIDLDCVAREVIDNFIALREDEKSKVLCPDALCLKLSPHSSCIDHVKSSSGRNYNATSPRHVALPADA